MISVVYNTDTTRFYDVSVTAILFWIGYWFTWHETKNSKKNRSSENENELRWN